DDDDGELLPLDHLELRQEERLPERGDPGVEGRLVDGVTELGRFEHDSAPPGFYFVSDSWAARKRSSQKSRSTSSEPLSTRRAIFATSSCRSSRGRSAASLSPASRRSIRSIAPSNPTPARPPAKQARASSASPRRPAARPQRRRARRGM